MTYSEAAAQRRTTPAELLRIQRDLGIQLSAATSLNTTLGQVLTACLQIQGIDCGGVYLMEEQTGALDLIAAQGLSDVFVAAVSHFDGNDPRALLTTAGSPVYIPFKDIAPTDDPAWKSEVLRATAVIPILHEGRVIAVLNLASHQCDGISQDVRDAVEAVATQIGGVIARLRAEEGRKRAVEELERYRNRLEHLVRERTADLTQANQRLMTEIHERMRVEAALRRSEQELHARSLKDELTNLHNRRGFMLLAEQQIRLAERSRVGLWLLFADLDSLKWINDELGHVEGDQALVDTAEILRRTFRGSDVVARFAGDEFAVLATTKSRLDTGWASHRLHAEVEKFNGTVTRPYRLSLSWGFAYREPGNSFDLNEMIRQADRRMYETKRRAKRFEG